MPNRITAILLVVLAAGCASAPPVPVPAFDGMAENTCLPEAIVVAESFARQGIKAEIIIVRSPTFSHAIVAFLYPAELPLLWVWDVDNRSVQIEADFTNASSIAVAWFKATFRDEIVINAEFI